MHSQKSTSKKPSVPSDAWELIESVLKPSEPNPDKPHSTLIAEQERLRIRAVLEHRLNVFGVNNDT